MSELKSDEIKHLAKFYRKYDKEGLLARIAELEAENDRLQSGWFRDETICPDGSLRPTVSQLLSRIAELEEKQRWIPVSERLPEAERKEFCPNCEAETPCTHEAELYVCDICGEDFAKYIVSRNCNVSDVSITQDVLTDVKTPRSIENTNPDYYKDDAVSWISIANGRLPEKFQECIVLDKNKRVHNWIHDDALLPLFAEYTHWMPLPTPPEAQE